MGLRTPPFRASLLLFSLLGTLAAAPKLRLVKSAIGPISIAAGANGPAQTVEAYNAGDGSLNLKLASSVPWMSATVGAARSPCATTGLALSCLPVQIALQTASLAKGLTTGTITLSDPNAVDAPQTLTVTVAIGGNVPDRIEMYVAPNGASARSPISTNTYVQANVSAPWLAVAADSAGSYRFGITYSVIATQQAGMNEGDYRASFAISGSSFASDNKTVQVLLHVTSQPIADAPARLKFRIAQGTPKQAQYLAVNNRGIAPLTVSGVTASTTSGGGWLSADKPAAVTALTIDPTGLSPGTYQGSLAVASNAVNGPLTVPVELEVVAQAPPLAFYRGAVSNATFDADDPVAPGDIMAVFGEQLAFDGPQGALKVPLDRQLGKTRVLVNGQPAPLYYSSYGQMNFQLPFETPLGEALVRVERDGQAGNTVSVEVIERDPHILPFGEYGVVLFTDGALAMPVTPGVPSRPAHAGDVLTMYVTGLGATNPPVATGTGAPLDPLAMVPAPLKVFFGQRLMGASVPADPQFVGMTPNLVGLYQVNVAVPDNAPRGMREPLYLDLGNGGRISNQVLIAIE